MKDEKPVIPPHIMGTDLTKSLELMEKRLPSFSPTYMNRKERRRRKRHERS